jgi:hypothetical protein
MAFEKGDIEPADVAIGLKGAGRQPSLVRQMLQPGVEGLGGGHSPVSCPSSSGLTRGSGEERDVRLTSAQSGGAFDPRFKPEDDAKRAGT